MAGSGVGGNFLDSVTIADPEEMGSPKVGVDGGKCPATGGNFSSTPSSAPPANSRSARARLKFSPVSKHFLCNDFAVFTALSACPFEDGNSGLLVSWDMPLAR